MNAPRRWKSTATITAKELEALQWAIVLFGEMAIDEDGQEGASSQQTHAQLSGLYKKLSPL